MKGIYGNEHTESIRVMHMRSFVSNSFQPQWTVAHQTPLSMEFSRQEYWSRFRFLIPGDLPNQGIETVSHASPPLAGKCFTTSATWEVLKQISSSNIFTTFLSQFLTLFLN